MKNQKPKPMNKNKPEAKVKSKPRHKPPLFKPLPKIMLPKINLPSLPTLPGPRVKSVTEKSKKFSPPSDLDSGFTPFFKESKYFDEESYFANLTTTVSTEPSTTSTTTPRYRAVTSKIAKIRRPVKKYYPTEKSYYSQASATSTTTPLPFMEQHWDTFEKDFPQYEPQRIEEQIVENRFFDKRLHGTEAPKRIYTAKSGLNEFNNFPVVDDYLNEKSSSLSSAMVDILVCNKY